MMMTYPACKKAGLFFLLFLHMNGSIIKINRDSRRSYNLNAFGSLCLRMVIFNVVNLVLTESKIF